VGRYDCRRSRGVGSLASYWRGVCRVTLQASKTEDRDLELHNRAAQRKRACGTFRSKLFRQSIVPEVPKTAGKKKCFGPFSHSCDKEHSSNCQLTSYVEHLMSDDYVFLEYQAKITNAGHAEYEGEAVHCMIKVKSVDEHGKRRRNVELEQQAGDNVLFVINPGPHKKISHSSILSVSEETFQKAGTAPDQHRVGDCEIFFYPRGHAQAGEPERSGKAGSAST